MKKNKVKASIGTIWKASKDLGFKFSISNLEIELTDEDKERRVIWCRENKDRDWTLVIFSDESGISS